MKRFAAHLVCCQLQGLTFPQPGGPFSFLSLALLLALWGSFSLFAQSPGSVRGQVVDEEGNPVPGAVIFLQGTVLGTTADEEGYFHLEEIPPGQYRLRVEMLGYYPQELPVRLQAGERLNLGQLRLRISPLSGEAIVVTASKYEQNVQEVPHTMVSMDRQEILSRHVDRLDAALRYLPGVYLNGSQINIRGSSGFSLGVGSRVLLLLDGMPMMTGDTREVNFETIPVQLVERIEVFKGAGSALYGSSALGGVINVITRDLPVRNGIYLRTYGGAYSRPYYAQWRWRRERGFLNGQRGHIALRGESAGLLAGFSRDEDDGYRQNGWRRTWRFTGKATWQPTPFQQISLFASHLRQKRGNFLFWQDLNHALQPPPGQQDDWVESRRTYVQSQYRYLISSAKFLVLRLLWFHNRFQDNVATGEGNRSRSDHFEGDLQFTSQWSSHFFTVGGQSYWSGAKANIFGRHRTSGGAVYLQDEWQLASPFTLTLGARWDLFHMDSVGTRQRINPKAGVVWAPVPGTAFRASLGTGFRAPSLAEVFTSTVASGLQVIPNLNLKPEKSLSAEVGWNQHFGKWVVGDVAFFVNRYWDLIEGRIDPEAGAIQFQNITRARVLGVELYLLLHLLKRTLSLQAGYTYSEAIDLELNDFLYFRPRHLFYGQGILQKGPFQLGVDYRFISRYDRIDPRLSALVSDVEVRNDAHVVDVRLNGEFLLFGQKCRIGLQINNLLQYHYLERAGSLAPIRHGIVTVEIGE